MLLVISMNKASLRHFSHYRCHAIVTFCIAGIEYVSEFHTEFICAFCRRSLEACVRLGKYLPFPSRYFTCVLEFEDFGYVDAADAKYRNFIKYTNYDGITAQLVRALIWDISISNICNYGKEEIERRLKGRSAH